MGEAFEAISLRCLRVLLAEYVGVNPLEEPANVRAWVFRL
jgi:hypothetical protein